MAWLRSSEDDLDDAVSPCGDTASPDAARRFTSRMVSGEPTLPPEVISRLRRGITERPCRLTEAQQRQIRARVVRARLEKANRARRCQPPPCDDLSLEHEVQLEIANSELAPLTIEFV